MSTLNVDLSPEVMKIANLHPGEAFIWEGHLCTYINQNLQYIAGVGEKLRLNSDTKVRTLSPEISIDGVRQWIRKEWPRTNESRKEISLLEKLVLISEVS
ncbi:MAG: hypothetical protein ABJF65_00180 [Reichenbachiella sp.]|uniref:hypothetical protein n=1 Tax=Reichenbachiella sp. TaxID=2184521 RepID=UPI0032660FA0